jgi:hypothetical protein
MASNYVVPQVQTSQEFVSTPAFANNPLPALILGPQYDLRRYLVAAEQPLTSAANPDGTSGNVYDPADDVAYPYPNQDAGTVVDTDYVEVYMENVQARYLPNTDLGSDSGKAALELITAPSGSPYPNRVRFTTGSGTVLQTANSVNRSAWLASRDAQIGDFIKITDNLNNVTLSKIKAFYPDTHVQNGALAATVGASLVSHSDGVANGTTTFTSATGAFTQALQGKFITITGKGTYQILQVNSATSLGLSGTVVSGSTLVYHIGGIYNDVGNVALQAQVINNVPAYSWLGSGSDPGVTDIDLATTDTTAYVGYPIARISSDTYTVTCTTSGSLTTAVFSIASAAGAFSTKTGQTLASALLTLDNAGGNTVIWDFTGSTGSPVFTAGQSWSVLLKAAVTLDNPTAAGTYTGAVDNTYKLTVVQGGPMYDGTNAATAATFSITSSNIDSAPAVQPQASVAFSVGNYGVTATFTAGPQNSQFIPGDIYYIDVKAAIVGAVKMVEFNNSLPSASLTLASSWTAELLLVKSSTLIPEYIDPVTGTTNWVASTSTLTLDSGIAVTDPNLIVSGILADLPIETGNVFIQHRDLNLTNVNSIGSVTSLAAIPGVLGTVDPDNAIAQGVYEAVNNSGGVVPVYFISVPSDDITGYNAALAISAKSNTVYSLVPTTFDAEVKSAVVSQVNALSTPVDAQWRIAWLSEQLVTSTLVYDLKPDGSAWLGTVVDDPALTGTQYQLVQVPGATFVTDGVRIGDNVLINFTVDANGAVTSSVLPVASVRTEDSVVLATPLTAGIAVATKVQIQRTYTKDEQINNLAAIAASYANRRVRVIFPDTCLTGTVVKNGYFLAAALAGLRSSVVPHQGLTNTQILGFTDFTKTVITFSQAQLNVLAASGVWIVTQATIGAVPYTRQQLTTDMTDVDHEEDSVTTNVDAISYGFNGILQPFIGKYNRNPDTLQLISNALKAQINFLLTNTTTATAGAQLLDGSQVVSVTFDPLFKDRINIVLQLVVPAPVNVITLALVVS